MAKGARSNNAGARAALARKRNPPKAAHLEGLNFRQRMFVLAYLGEANGNATEAARIAGYAEPNTQGPRLLVNVGIRVAIDAKLNHVALSADETLARLSDMASADMADFTDPSGEDGFTLNLAKARASGKTHLIKKLAHTKDGVRIELHDAQGALEKLARYHGLLKDRVEHTGRDGGPIDVTVSDRTKAQRELEEWRREMTARALPSSMPSVQQTPPTSPTNTE